MAGDGPVTLECITLQKLNNVERRKILTLCIPNQTLFIELLQEVHTGHNFQQQKFQVSNTNNIGNLKKAFLLI